MVNKDGYIVFDDFLPQYDNNGKERESFKAINKIVNDYKNEIEVIGLIDDIVECYKIKDHKNLNFKNIDFIIKKI